MDGRHGMRGFRLFWAGACCISSVANIVGSIMGKDAWQLLFGVLCLILCVYLLFESSSDESDRGGS